MDFHYSLGNTVKKVRKQLGLTQLKAAEICSIDSRTILNIENFRGNPKMEILFPLVRGLQIDSQEIFYPEIEQNNQAIRQLRLVIAECTEGEAAALIPVVQSFLEVVRSNTAAKIK